MSIEAAMDVGASPTRVADALGALIASLLSVLFWLLAVAVAGAYAALWLDVVRLHLLQGDVVGAVGTFVVATGVLVGVVYTIDWR